MPRKKAASKRKRGSASRSSPLQNLDAEREDRIEMEIVVDAYDESERAMSWYYYLENQLHFPFLVRCRSKRTVSLLEVGDEVQVTGMSPDEECEHEMFVMARFGKKKQAVPLSQLAVVTADEETRTAVEDWHYWVRMGYQM